MGHHTKYLDFSKAKHTAIISDLHLCEAEPINPKYPLWKKYKTRQFFFDNIFHDFLEHIKQKSEGEPIELILNGDIFDFDSILSLPEYPLFKVSWLEKKRGLFPRQERAKFKMQVILKDHSAFFKALRSFILEGHRVVFIIGNHDLELHFKDVQEEILLDLDLTEAQKLQVRFVDWFYISNGDTLIEHGNQYDPYCMCEDPINPYIRGYNYVSLKLPFGNLACRYIMNGLGFFNPHIDSAYIMSFKSYIKIFLRYMVKAQPFLVLTWFFGASTTLFYSFVYRLASPIRNPLKIEDRIEEIAIKSNAQPRMVRELKELFAAPAASNPFLLLRELWLDRSLLILLSFFIILEVMVVVKSIFNVSFFWAFIPLFIMLPFFLFYSRSVTSLVSGYKEPDDRIIAMASTITNVKRIIFGHTHQIRHEVIGSVEHLNSGCWSPAFLDVECTKPIDQKTYIWITQKDDSSRAAELLKFENGESKHIFKNS